MKKENILLPKIPLFDIDWTLLKGGDVGNKIHHQAFDFALHQTYNQPTASVNECMGQGKIDTQILIEVLALHGVPEQQAKEQMPDAIKTMRDYFFTHINEGIFEPMPGAKSLLSDLKEKRIPLGLLTGNVAEIGWEKMRKAGLKDYFSFGAFGSMAFKRVDLIEIARKEASKVLGKEISTNQLVIVGDSPLDIACARGGGIQVIAVGAGHHKIHELMHADLAVESLLEKDKIFKFLGL